MIPKAQSIKKKMDELEFIKMQKLLCPQRHHQENAKISDKSWKKKCANHVSAKTLSIKNSYNSIK